MSFSRSSLPVDLWIHEAFIIPGAYPSPLLQHIVPPEELPPLFDRIVASETSPKRTYWSLLREQLPQMVRIHKFKNLAEAGSIVLWPHEMHIYQERGMLESITQLNRQILSSGRTPMTFTGYYSQYQEQPGEIVFSYGTFRSDKDIAIPTPAWMFDLGDSMTPISKPSIPTVGFVGCAQYTGDGVRVWRYLPIPEPLLYWSACRFFVSKMRRGLRKKIGERLREATLQAAERSPHLKTSLIRRNHWNFNLSEEQQVQEQREYIQNLQNNAYILCPRGAENYSFRLYETMSAGRIPVIIDTNMRLPDLGNLQWSDFSVIVPCSKIHHLGEIIQAFHDRLSQEEFDRMCQRSRAAFEYLLPHHFMLRYLQQLRSS